MAVQYIIPEAWRRNPSCPKPRRNHCRGDLGNRDYIQQGRNHLQKGNSAKGLWAELAVCLLQCKDAELAVHLLQFKSAELGVYLLQCRMQSWLYIYCNARGLWF